MVRSKKATQLLNRPILGTGAMRKCKLCGTETTWTINEKPVCPKCCYANGWINYELKPCGVCGAPGEWATGGDEPVNERTRFLCMAHYSAWFRWEPLNRLLPQRTKENAKWWEDAWDKAFTTFVTEIKGEGKLCPYCGQIIQGENR